MMKTLVLAATAMAFASPALAQAPTAQPPVSSTTTVTTEAEFMKADGDKSGSLSIAEVKMADATVTQADFDKHDADKNKSLSKAEFDKWAMAKHGDKPAAPGQ
jgi:hypothetical protein